MSIYRSKQFCKEDGYDISEKRRVIFLDIDGVLQPTRNERRFRHRMEETAQSLCEKYDDEIYLSLNRYDVAAVYYDWDLAAVGILKKLIEETCSEVVVHSSWIYGKSIEQLKALFRIHDLDVFITGIAESPDRNKERAIQKYLEENPDVSNYIVIDDDFFIFAKFGEHSCWTREFMNTKDYDYCEKLLYNDYHFEYEQEDEISKITVSQIHRDDPDDMVGNVKYEITEYEKDGKLQKIALFCINLKRYYDTINDYSLILNHIVSYFYKQDIKVMIADYQKEMDGQCRLLQSYSIPRYPRCEGEREYGSVFLISLGYNSGYDYLKNAPESLPDMLRSLKEENRWM
ncbi:HAD domain-containing protein [[Clostridium] innocuum]|nr:HAD domain-containing protein [[Clostridium] innocuum]